MLASLGGLVSCAAKVHFKEQVHAMNYPTIVDGIDFRQLVTAADGEPITDSFQIAKAFGKRHADVLRALKNCHCSEDFRRAHFCVAEKNQ